MILTIDFDIMMWKDLEVYNNLIRNMDFKEVEKQHPMLSQVRFDLSAYIRLTNLLDTFDKSKIHFVRSHEEVMPFIKNGDDVINIDHHHDVCYDRESNIIVPTCANWVRYKTDNDVIKSYWWIGDSQSVPLEEDLSNIYIQRFDVFENFNLSEIPKEEIREIIICLSPQWVPEKYYEYYKRWENRYGNRNQLYKR